MFSISNRTGSIDPSPSSWETGNPTAPSGQEDREDLIFQANTVPLLKIMRHYGIRLDEVRSKVRCPFKSHMGGKENTASFWFYPENNSFYCFGCGKGGKHAHGVKFVAWMDDISEYLAATRILRDFAGDVDESLILDDASDFSERLKIMMEFSNSVREFRKQHSDPLADQFIDEICQVYDQLNLKHTLNNEALNMIVEQLKEKMQGYQV
jgi:hypothetical protein